MEQIGDLINRVCIFARKKRVAEYEMSTDTKLRVQRNFGLEKKSSRLGQMQQNPRDQVSKFAVIHQIIKDTIKVNQENVNHTQ